MSNPFDKVYKNVFNEQIDDLKRNYTENVTEDKPDNDNKKYEEFVDINPDTIMLLIERFRRMENAQVTEAEGKALEAFQKKLLKESEGILKETFELKGSIAAQARAGGAYEHKIKKKATKKAMLKVFGKDTDVITLDDYIMALEMKRVIEVQEAFSLFEDVDEE